MSPEFVVGVWTQLTSRDSPPRTEGKYGKTKPKYEVGWSVERNISVPFARSNVTQ
jgi:hypothetical protein